MKSLRHLIAVFALIGLTDLVSAANAVHLRSDGLQLKMTPQQPKKNSRSTVAAAKVDVKINRRSVVLHWAASPFFHTVQPELLSDTVLAATVTRLRGKVAVTPERIVDRTDLARGDDTAAFAMGMTGSGRVSINMEVGIDNAHAAAGEHCATVVLTLTGQ